MGRKRKKPEYNSAELDQNYLEQVADYYENLIKVDLVKADSEESMFKYVILTAGEFGTTPMKMRKLLITAGVYSTTTSKLIAELYAEGKNVKEIQAITGLKNPLLMDICRIVKSYIIMMIKALELIVLDCIESDRNL